MQAGLKLYCASSQLPSRYPSSVKEGGGPLPLGNRGVVHMPVTPTYPGVYIEEIPSIRGSMGGSIP